MAIYGYTKNYKLIKPQFNTDTWHDYIYDNLDTIDAVMSAIYASGNWKGFWAKNMTYVTGDVIIDQDTDTMYKVMIDHVTSADTFAAEQTAHPDYYELWSPNNLAESWATKTDGKVSNTDYSAKAYAISSGLIDDGSAKEWAIGSGAIGNTNEYSAKKYATDAHNDYISLTTNVNVVAVGSNIANVNTVGQSISNVNTVANNISDVDTAALNIEAIKDAPNQANAASQSASDASQSATNAANSATASANSATSASASAQAAQDALNDVHGLIATPIGTIFQSVYVDESLDIARRLNGQLISSTKFTGFRSWLNTVQTSTPSLFTTETNWQAEKTNSKLGQCGKFVIDDDAGTIRLPAVVNAQGLTDLALIGVIKSESLPNITGEFGGSYYVKQGNVTDATGAFENTKKVTSSRGGGENPTGSTYNFNASRSSSTYQDNAPVQQEAVQYPYYIQVATGVEETLPAIREYNINTPFFFGQSMYSDVAPDNASWLASNGQYNARSVYPDYYDWLLEQMNAGVSGFVSSTAAYTDYDFVINTADQTFRLPLLDGSEDLPSDRYENLTLTSTTQRFTAPANGIYTVAGIGFGWVDIANETSGAFGSCSQPRTSDGFGRYIINAKQGDQIVVYCGAVPSSYTCRFIYDQGNGTLYYYVGDTLQDASLINTGAVLSQLSNKADINASNFNADGKSLLSGLGMPSNRYIDLTLGASGSSYTAPANGWFAFYCGSICDSRIVTKGGLFGNTALGKSDFANNNTVSVLKGDTVTLKYSTSTGSSLRFYYCEGEE